MPTRRSCRVALSLCALLAIGCAHAPVPFPVTVEPVGPTLIPRAVIFGNPERTLPKISPDGSRIAFVAPAEGVLNVWVAPAGSLDKARPVTADRGRGIWQYWWAYTNRHMLYLQDRDGDENWRLSVLDLDTGRERCLTPAAGVRAELTGLSSRFPAEVLVAQNDRNPQFHEVYRFDIVTGASRLIQPNDRFLGFVADDDFRIRLAVAMTKDGGVEWSAPDGDGWRSFISLSAEDGLTTEPVGFDRAGGVLFLKDSRGRDTAALFGVDMASGGATLIAEGVGADVTEVMFHPIEKTVQAVAWERARIERRFLDPAVAADFERLWALGDGEYSVDSRSLDDRLWVVRREVSDGPLHWYLFDRRDGRTELLFVHRPALFGLPLARMHPVAIPVRDGLELTGYLSLPHGLDRDGRPPRPLPLVLNVHGGPWARDSWGYVPEHQWLASRGYAVLSVNYRGSTGFGKRFINAGDREWGGRMHDDLVDAVGWAAGQRIADPARVAIMGWSYGGFATLTGMTLTPELFACGVAGVGPSNLITFMQTIPPYWMPAFELLARRIGDPRTEEGRAFLMSRSPISRVDRISRPLLIGQGSNDPRVRQSESDQIVQAMKASGIPVIYALYPDEGHGFARPQNRTSFYALAEPFLARCLGGASEPVGVDLEGSSVLLTEGADLLPGVAEALSGRP